MSTNQTRRGAIFITKLLLAGGVVGVGAMLGIGTANAMTETEIKSYCASNNGTYQSGTSVDGHTVSRCVYEDKQGHTFHGMWDNGEFVGTGTGPRTQPPAPKLPRNTLPGGVSVQQR